MSDPYAVIARVLRESPATEARLSYACYVALGDSFSAGTGCEPGKAWPDLLARTLRRRSPDLVYSNLGQEGARSDDVVEQSSVAVQLEPDLITVVCGANDALLSVRPDPDAYARNLTRIFRRLRGAVPSASIVTATSPERWNFLELGPRTQRRVTEGIAGINEATRRVAADHEIPCLDVASHPGLFDAENFGEDGLHPSAAGHAHAAACFIQLIETHDRERSPRSE